MASPLSRPRAPTSSSGPLPPDLRGFEPGVGPGQRTHPLRGGPAKTALCVSGQLRHSALTAPHWIARVVRPLYADIFIHTSTPVSRLAIQRYNATGRLAAVAILPGPVQPAEYLDAISGGTSSGQTWRDAIAANADALRYNGFGGLPGTAGSGLVMLTHRYGCLGLVLQEERRRGAVYSHIAWGRPDYAWTADHPPLAFLDPILVHAPNASNNYSGLQDHYLVANRTVMTEFLRVFHDIAVQNPRGRLYCAFPFGSEVHLKRYFADVAHVAVSRFPNVGFVGCGCSRAGLFGHTECTENVAGHGLACRPSNRPGSPSAAGCRFHQVIQAGVKRSDHGALIAVEHGDWINRCGWGAGGGGRRAWGASKWSIKVGKGAAERNEHAIALASWQAIVRDNKDGTCLAQGTSRVQGRGKLEAWAPGNGTVDDAGGRGLTAGPQVVGNAKGVGHFWRCLRKLRGWVLTWDPLGLHLQFPLRSPT